MAFRDEIKAKQKEIVDIVNDALLIAESNAKFDYAPRGATKDLRSGIEKIDAKLIGGVVTGGLAVYAKSVSLFDYAKKQHDEPLQHVSEQPFRSSFADLGTSGTAFRRYGQGYRKAEKSRPFATKYLDKGLQSIETLIDKALDNL